MESLDVLLAAFAKGHIYDIEALVAPGVECVLVKVVALGRDVEARRSRVPVEQAARSLDSQRGHGGVVRVVKLERAVAGRAKPRDGSGYKRDIVVVG